MVNNFFNRAFLKTVRLIITLFTKINSRKIILVVESNSGSNSFALSKLFTNEVKNHFEIEILFEVSSNNFLQYLNKHIKLSRAKYIFTTHASYKPSKKNIHFQLWHGAFLKKNGIMLTDKREKKVEVQKSWHQADYVLSYSETYSTFMNACMAINPNKYLIFGAPRNDFFFLSNGLENFFKALNLKPLKKKIIFFMPTFKESIDIKLNNKDNNIFTFSNWDYNEFNKFLETNNYILVIKSHPHYGNKETEIIKESNIFFLNDKILNHSNLDLYEIMNCVDLLITDYSSIFYDFLLLDKPILFTSTDIEKYKYNRGFLIESYENYVPGPIANTQKELQFEINKLINNNLYFEQERLYMKKFMHRYFDGNSSVRFSNFLLSL